MNGGDEVVAEIVLTVAREGKNENVPALLQRAPPARVVVATEDEGEAMTIKKIIDRKKKSK